MAFIESILNITEETKNELVDTHKKPSLSIQKAYEKVVNILVDMRTVNQQHAKKIKFNSRNEISPSVLENSRKLVLVAGGSLSEAFIETYEEAPRDVDIFIETKKLANEFSTIGVHPEKVKRFGELFADALQTQGHFVVRQREQLIQGYHDFLEVHYILSGYFYDQPETPVEVILTEEVNAGFDLAFREFYYNGGTIFATTSALKDIKEKEVVINHLNSPFSTLVRAREFSKRYGFNIEPISYQWLLKKARKWSEERVKPKVLTYALVLKEVEERLGIIQKYTDNWTAEELASAVWNEVVTEKEDRTLREMDGYFGASTVQVFRSIVQIQRIKNTNPSALKDTQVFDIQPMEPKMSFLRNLKDETLLTVEEKKNFLRYFEELEIKQKMKELFGAQRLDKEMEIEVFDTYIKALEEMNLENIRGNFHSSGGIVNEINRVKMDLIAETRNPNIEFFAMKEMDLMEEDFNYFGTQEDAKRSILGDKLKVTVDLSDFLFTLKSQGYKKQLRFDVKYDGDSEKEKKTMVLDANQNKVYFGGSKFAYLIGERFDEVKQLIFEEMNQMPEKEAFRYEMENIAEFNTSANIKRQEVLTEEQTEIIRYQLDCGRAWRDRMEEEEEKRRLEEGETGDLPF